MNLPQNPVVIIPARLAATRLPGKILADIHGEPMIVHVWRRAVESGIGPVIVACDDRGIAEAVEAAGGQAVMTDPAHPSGSDRIFEALTKIDEAGTYDAVVNVQGDLPAIDPGVIGAVFAPLADPVADIATLAFEITDAAEAANPNVVKAVVSFAPGENIGRALNFTRAVPPDDEGPLYHHVGLYAYRRAALERFVALSPSALEKREKLEQLRALEAGMVVDVALVDTVPPGVDTPADLEQARAMLEPKSGP
jgi:3-deoxy-manno-octulosonate cytidylyltransferase (CMP-KDO synthetase)